MQNSKMCRTLKKQKYNRFCASIRIYAQNIKIKKKTIQTMETWLFLKTNFVKSIRKISTPIFQDVKEILLINCFPKRNNNNMRILRQLLDQLDKNKRK